VHRRSFLQLMGLLPLASLAAPGGIHRADPSQPPANRPSSILILVFDALSAGNMSLYGYPRPTTPNVDGFAERASVYHRHYAGGNFTTPGTASLLTGVYPWKHRATHVYGQARPEYERKNIFAAFDQVGLHRTSYTHNDLAEVLLFQFRSNIDRYLKAEELALFYDSPLSEGPLFGDRNAAFFAERAGLRGGNQWPASLFSSILQRVWRTKEKSEVIDLIRKRFPLGAPTLPGASLMFTLEDGIDYLEALIGEAEQPFLGYFHFYPPHGPFHTRREFVGVFDDGYVPVSKPDHFFSEGKDEATLNRERQRYDEYIAYMDAEFGRLVEFMEAGGHFENTVLVFTSDHGQMFERGILGHTTETLFEPIVRIPLLIALPQSGARQDIRVPTSCVDLLPSLLAMVGESPPSWTEGRRLPFFEADEETESGAVFSVEAKTNARNLPLTTGTVAMMEGTHKLIHYLGYPGFQNAYEFYDLAEDPEELEDLYPLHPPEAKRMQRDLEHRIDQVNQPFAS
jgi:arylsulfatase A-like enzyme